MTGKNMVIVSGYVGTEPEMKSTSTGKMVVRGSLGVPFGYGDSKRTIWVRYEAWEKTAQFINNWGRKGAALTLVGHLDVKEWQEDEKRRSDMVLIADQAEFALAGKENPRPHTAPWRAEHDGDGAAFKMPEEEPKQAAFTDANDDDLPF